jgi:hypothetical protein
MYHVKTKTPVMPGKTICQNCYEDDERINKDKIIIKNRAKRLLSQNKCVYHPNEFLVEGKQHCLLCKKRHQLDYDAVKARGVCPSHRTVKVKPGHVWCEACVEKNARNRQILKQDVIDHYGGQCSCCGEKILDFLTVDHILGDGGRERKVIPSSRVYHFLKRNNYPKDRYRILCFNCNCGRRQGICPHKK